MTLKDWVSETKDRFRDESLTVATKESAYELYIGGLRKTGQAVVTGDSIWDEEWDVLVLMDACRYDAFEETFGDDTWYTSCEKRTSVGSTSAEWMEKTFDTEKYADEISNTVYVSGNPFTEDYIETNAFQDVVEVWKDAWDEDIGTMMPQPLTDTAIQRQREENPERLIIHYMQPHHPFVNYPVTKMDVHNFGDDNHKSEFDMIREGTMDVDEVWNRYLDNLEFIVTHIQENLLGNISGTVVLSADHGELFGEYGVYEHGWYIPLKPVKNVPWVEVESTDTKEYTPTEVVQTESVDAEMRDVDEETEERLRDLGYM